MSRDRTSGALLAAVLLGASGCGVSADTAAPRCTSAERLALVAQSVPEAAYVPCLRDLPQGWRTAGFDAVRGSARVVLESDRSGGYPVEVVLEPDCDVAGASAADSPAPGVRSALRLTSVSPRWAGTRYDAFAGGCVQYRFDFPRGAHIALMEEMSVAVGLVSRRELRLRLRDELGVELDR